MREQAPWADLIVTWGKEGAYDLDHLGQVYHSPASPPAEVKDTLGVGDTFNAGLIDAYLRRPGLSEALMAAAWPAGSAASLALRGWGRIPHSIKNGRRS